VSLAARAVLLALLGLWTLGFLRHGTLGRLSFALGALTMLVALVWGGALLWRHRAGRQAP
jgi:hypothetical protein